LFSSLFFFCFPPFLNKRELKMGANFLIRC
jgi:hypothetical protein